MNNEELGINQIGERLSGLSKVYLSLRKAQWENTINHSQKNLVVQQNEEYNNKASELINDVENTDPETNRLIAKFLLLFKGEGSTSDIDNFIDQKLNMNQGEYSIITDVDNKIGIFRHKCLDFFVSSGENYQSKNEVFSIDKTNNNIANIIIETDISRAVVEQDIRNNETNLSINLQVLPKTFEITLKKDN